MPAGDRLKKIEISDLRSGNESAWNDFYALTHLKLERNLRFILKKGFENTDPGLLEDIKSAWLLKFWTRLIKRKIDINPAGALLDMRSIRNFVIDHFKHKDAVRDLIERKGTLISWSSTDLGPAWVGEEVVDIEKAFYVGFSRWKNDINFVGHQKSKIRSPFLQVAALEMNFNNLEEAAKRSDLLSLENVRQYYRLLERSYETLSGYLGKAYSEAALDQVPEQFMLSPWLDSAIACSPYLYAPEWVYTSDAPEEVKVHRRIHIDTLKCDSCMSWVGKTFEEERENPIIRDLTQQTIRTITGI